MYVSISSTRPSSRNPVSNYSSKRVIHQLAPPGAPRPSMAGEKHLIPMVPSLPVPKREPERGSHSMRSLPSNARIFRSTPLCDPLDIAALTGSALPACSAALPDRSSRDVFDSLDIHSITHCPPPSPTPPPTFSTMFGIDSDPAEDSTLESHYPVKAPRGIVIGFLTPRHLGSLRSAVTWPHTRVLTSTVSLWNVPTSPARSHGL